MKLRETLKGLDAAATGVGEPTADQRLVLRAVQLVMIAASAAFVLTMIVLSNDGVVSLLPKLIIGATVGLCIGFMPRWLGSR